MWGNFHPDIIFIATVQGVHCRTCESCKDWSFKQYLHKYGGPGVVYELVVVIHMWINGPFLALEYDITILRIEDGLMSKVPPGKPLIGDSGYIGEPEIVFIIVIKGCNNLGPRLKRLHFQTRFLVQNPGG